MTEPGRQITPDLTEVLRKALENRLCDLHTMLPGRVEEYSPLTGRATVRPLLKRKYRSETAATSLPLIAEVPVYFPKANAAHLALPLKPGDEGMLVFCERSIDLWADQGGEVDPNDPRKHHLSDAVFLPGLTSTPNTLRRKGSANSAEMANGLAYVELFASGKIKLSNSADEVLAILVDLLSDLLSATVVTALGASPFTIATQTRLQVIKTRLEAFKA
jgi:hypothetical protein